MKKFRVFGKNTKEWLDQKETFNGYTLCLTEYGGILATKIGQKDFMLLDGEVYAVCFPTYLEDAEDNDIYEHDMLWHKEHNCFYHVIRDHVTQGFLIQEVDDEGSIGMAECVSQTLNWISNSVRVGNYYEGLTKLRERIKDEDLSSK